MPGMHCICRDKIDEIMVAMDLADAYGTVVGGADMVMGVMLRGLSSGQQRRLQVATQMLANPNVMILDEPTTGSGINRSFKQWSIITEH